LTKPPAKNITASVRQRLLNKSRSDFRPFQELVQYYAMERLKQDHVPSEFNDIVMQVKEFLGPIAAAIISQKTSPSKWSAPGPWE